MTGPTSSSPTAEPIQMMRMSSVSALSSLVLSRSGVHSEHPSYVSTSVGMDS